MGLIARVTDGLGSRRAAGVDTRHRLWTVDPDSTGTWAYDSGAAGTLRVPAGARLHDVLVHASAAGASVRVAGGPSIPVPRDVGLDLDFRGRLTGPLDVIATGTDLVLAQYVSG